MSWLKIETEDDCYEEELTEEKEAEITDWITNTFLKLYGSEEDG